MGNRILIDRVLLLLAGVLVTAYAITFLMIESEIWILILLGGAGLSAVLIGLSPLGARLSKATMHSGAMVNVFAVLAMTVLTGVFYQEDYTLLLIATVLLYLVACLGLNIQFGFAGLPNFAGAAFFGAGCYTAAVLTERTALAPIFIVMIGGLVAAAIGALIIWPVLRTRGHYAALVTIAFVVLFKIFLEVNETLGGPQGLPVGSMMLLGWDFNEWIELSRGVEMSSYVNYVLGALVLLILAVTVTRRFDRSWIGLNLDAVRLDEVVSQCFGINVAYWKVVAFTTGNILIGMAGAFFGMMVGYIAPDNFTFGDSLIFVSIVVLGGLGSVWGAAVAAAIVVVLPEKLQIIQEYRYLLYAVLVILILLFRPSGLIPRRLRVYFTGFADR